MAASMLSSERLWKMKWCPKAALISFLSCMVLGTSLIIAVEASVGTIVLPRFKVIALFFSFLLAGWLGRFSSGNSPPIDIARLCRNLAVALLFRGIIAETVSEEFFLIVQFPIYYAKIFKLKISFFIKN
ncbi:unnamed protein product [Blepharisma stoltei]|uniref:GDT1 family protein n=1 Tax=Blepharisma stoltei TaxID=1481888 RepID=A0AAU9IZB0_9CILI|nr:unnamed protein product [Blepharisma stoltei]